MITTESSEMQQPAAAYGLQRVVIYGIIESL